MKTRNRLTAVALAAACANGAFAMDVAGFEFNGYSRGGPVWNSFNLPLWLSLNFTQDEPPPRQILVRLVSPVAAGAGLSSLWVGPREELLWQHRLREALQANIPFMASAAFLAIGLFSLAVWSRRRHETAYLLFFVSSALFFLRCIHYYSGDRRPLIPEEWFGWITVNSLGWLLVSVYFFTYRLHAVRHPWLERSVLVLMGLTTLATLPPLSLLAPVADLAPLAYLLQLVVMVVVTVVALWAARRSGNRAAMLMAGWNLTNIPVGVHDWMLQNMFISVESIYLLPYTGMGLFILFMGVVFQRYVGAVTEAEQASQRLLPLLTGKTAVTALALRPAFLLAKPERLTEAVEINHGPERLCPNGWVLEAQRDYFIGRNSKGQWLWLYRTAQQQWFVQGIFS